MLEPGAFDQERPRGPMPESLIQTSIVLLIHFGHLLLVVVVSWLVGWLVGWLAGWLAGWLVGWLVGWLTFPMVPRLAEISNSTIAEWACTSCEFSVTRLAGPTLQTNQTIL